MKELSLNILDIAENSLKAEATLTEISLREENDLLTMTITDNGRGMTPEILKRVTDPFTTTRTTRKVGLGIPLLKLAAEQTGGHVDIVSKHKDEFPDDHGTVVTAVFHEDSIDFPPIGDVISTVITLIQGHPDVDILFTHIAKGLDVRLDTREMREVLGGVPLSEPEVLMWARESLAEQYRAGDKGSVYIG